MAIKYASRWVDVALVPANQTSPPLLVPAQYEGLTVGAVPGAGGTLKVQFALCDPDELGTAQWYDWDDGAVASAVARVLTGAITALRAVTTVQPGRMEVVARFDR